MRIQKLWQCPVALKWHTYKAKTFLCKYKSVQSELRLYGMVYWLPRPFLTKKKKSVHHLFHSLKGNDKGNCLAYTSTATDFLFTDILIVALRKRAALLMRAALRKHVAPRECALYTQLPHCDEKREAQKKRRATYPFF